MTTAGFVSHRPVAYICIGNSDNKLSQQRWASFVSYVATAVGTAAGFEGAEIVFEGFSQSNSPYQNACWGLLLPDDPERVTWLKEKLADIAVQFWQDSISWALAPTTEFLGYPQAVAAAA